MKSRLIALIIIVSFITLFGGLYWYYYKSKISSIVFQSDMDTPYTISLEGKFGYKYFPLLDRAFLYKSTCMGSCIFSPIPPLEYKLTITGSGKEDIIDTIMLGSSEKKVYQVDLIPTLTITPIAKILSTPPSIGAGYIGDSLSGARITMISGQIPGEMSVLSSDQEGVLFSFSVPILSGRLDDSRQYIVLQGLRGEQYIYSLDGEKSAVFPREENIKIVTYADVWKILTEVGVYEYIGNSWVKNARFTDSIDISSRYRIGYIDMRDQAKLALQNYPLTESIFVLLDRKTAETSIIKKGKDILGFTFSDGRASILEGDGIISLISLDLDN